MDVDEGPGELPVVLNQLFPNPKNIHARSTMTYAHDSGAHHTLVSFARLADYQS